MLAFIPDNNTHIHSKGSIVEYELNGPMEEPTIDPIFYNLDELKTVLLFLQTLFPNGWQIYENQVMSIEQAHKLMKNSIPKKEEGTFIIALINGIKYQNNIYYKDFTTYESLPDAAKSKETKDDYEEFWKNNEWLKIKNIL